MIKEETNEYSEKNYIYKCCEMDADIVGTYKCKCYTKATSIFKRNNNDR